MNILLCSRWFSPSVGGVESVSELLAEEFSRLGCTVTVVTNTPGADEPRSYRVVRNPSMFDLFRLARQADVALQNLISLRTILPLMLGRVPIVIAHHCWLRRTTGELGWENFVKRCVLRAFPNISISQAMADSLPVKSEVIFNPFEARPFAAAARTASRTRDIVFLGRLVHDKGCSILIQALAELGKEALFPLVTIIGDGPERSNLEEECRRLGLIDQVKFLGSVRKRKEEILANHRIMVVPSLWNEPFGMVALEGLAAGCALVVSSGGGLREAAGKCALYFENGDVGMLASQLKLLLTDTQAVTKLLQAASSHLATFEANRIAHE